MSLWEPFHPQTCAKGPEICMNRTCPGGGYDIIKSPRHTPRLEVATMKTAKRLLALALAGVMTLALLTGCSDSSSQAKQVEEYFRYRRGQFADYQKDETLDKKLKVIARQFQPSWLDDKNGRLTGDAQNIIKKELGNYLVTGSVWLWVGEVKPEQSALAQAESMKYIQEIVIAPLAPNTSTLQAIAFTMTGKKSDGRRYYLALQTQATIKTP